MPLLRNRRPLKRWRYVGVYGPEVMLCAARVQVGPLRQSFWAVWDREEEMRHAHTRLLPGGAEVVMDGPEVRLDAGDVRARLRLGEAEPIECVCASGERGYAWTRKRAGLPVEGTIEAAGRSWKVEALGVDDESAGYHRRHTAWHWSAGVGGTADGRSVAWNLVAGINDPPSGSERGIWVDGSPSEPDPVSFDGLAAIRFGDGSEMRFAAESERARDDNLLVVRSRYRHVFGSFTGMLAGLELSSGLGVMEEHEATW
jgi:Protein of unknown function (DUF2804)